MAASKGHADTGGGRRARIGGRIALLLTPLIVVGEAVFGPGVLVQLDALLAFEPWRGVAPAGYAPANPLLLDQSLVVLPWLEFAAERLRAGELPLWNPYDYLGQPLHAALSGAFLWPLSWLFFLVPDWATLAFVAWAKLALCGLGMHALLLRLRARPHAAVAGALGWQLGGFQIAWLGHPHTNATLLLPWLLLALEALVRAQSGRFPRREVAVLAALGALLGVGGHLPTAWHVALVGAAWVGWRAFAPPPGADDGAGRLPTRRLGALALAALLAAALAAAQLLPFAEYTAEGRGVAAAERVAAAVADALPPARDVAPMLAFPHWHGDPLAGTYTGPSGPHVNFNELVGGYAGAVLLALALVALVLRRRERGTWFVALLGGCAALVAWRVPPFGAFAELVPGLGATKALRLLAVTAFATALLGALGLDALLARVRGGRARAAVAAVALLALVAELAHFAHGYNPTVDRALVLPPTRTGAFLASRPFGERALGVDATILIPNANLFLRVPLITGYDSIERREVADVVALLSSDELGAWFVKEIRTFDRPLPLAGLLGVRWVLSEGELPAPFTLAHEGEVRAYENPHWQPPAFVARGVELVADPAERLAVLASPDLDPTVVPVERVPVGVEPYLDPPGTARGAVEWLEHAPLRRRLVARLERPGLLVLTSAYDDGWRATVDGTAHPIERVAHALEGLWLPAGEHTVELAYRPTAFAVGAALAALALPILLLMALPRRPRPRPSLPAA